MKFMKVTTRYRLNGDMEWTGIPSNVLDTVAFMNSIRQLQNEALGLCLRRSTIWKRLKVWISRMFGRRSYNK